MQEFPFLLSWQQFLSWKHAKHVPSKIPLFLYSLEIFPWNFQWSLFGHWSVLCSRMKINVISLHWNLTFWRLIFFEVSLFFTYGTYECLSATQHSSMSNDSILKISLKYLIKKRRHGFQADFSNEKSYFEKTYFKVERTVSLH